MSDYLRVRLGAEYSEYTNYARPTHDIMWMKELTPDQGYQRRLAIDTDATSLTISEFTTVTCFIVRNTHASDDVTVTYTSSGAATACAFQIPAGDFAKITDVDPTVAPTFQAGAGAVTIHVMLAGA